MKNTQGGIVRARRLDVMLALVLGLLMVSGAELAQGDPTSNVNLIGMTPDPNDIPDIGYRQQNEPACAIRPDDSACIICAYNDYRGVDFPIGNPIGDSWLGVSQSCDAGATWRSRIMPGHPGDLDAAVIPAAFAADPRLVAIPGVGNPGMAILNFIAGFRDTNVGVLGIQHWLEVNKEDADHYEPGNVTWFADTGTSGRFIDKPEILGVLDLPNQQGTVNLLTDMENSELGVIDRDFPTGKLYVAYAVLTGSNSFKVLFNTSDDWGRTWKNQTSKLSEDQNEVSGVSLTAIGNKVLAVWRRKGDNNDTDAIMYSVISNGGKKATKAEVLADICAFDQPTLAGESFDLGSPAGPDGPFVAFRTNDFPWAATDGVNVFVFFSEKQRNPDGSCDVFSRPRIVMNYSPNAGQTWLGEPGSDPVRPMILDEPVNPDSFQFMPTAFGANGKIQVAWYDTRREIFGGAATPWPFVTDYDVADSLFVQRAVDVYTTSVTLTGGTLDISPPIQISQYSQQLAQQGSNLFYFDTEANLANKKLFGQGTASFLGDYLAMAARAFRPTSNGKWESNASPRPPGLGGEDFFAAWADNRDVVGEVLGLTDPSSYGFEPETGMTDLDQEKEAADELLADSRPAPTTGPPRDTTKTAEGLDGTDNIVACVPGAENERTRDSNIYGSLIKDNVRLYAPTPSKPLSGLKRAFPVSLTNSTEGDLEYTLRIDPPGVASFRQQSSKNSETFVVRARSTEARTVFVDPFAVSSFNVIAEQGGAIVSTIELGDTPDFSDPENCVDGVGPDGVTPCDVGENELHNLELQELSPEAAALLNAALLNAALLNVGVQAGDLREGEVNAALLNAALLNADLLNANLLNPTLVALAEEGGSADPTCGSTNPDDILYPSLCPGYVGDPIIADIINFAVADGGETINAALLNAALLNAALLNANLLNANLLNANLLNANLLNANLLNANLLNANLLNTDLENANLLNANLLNADLENANLLNANLLNANLLNATFEADPTATVTYDDYTYPVTNNGNVTTSVNADIQISAPAALDEDGNPIDVDADGNPIPNVLGTKLIAWTANATPTRVDCEDRVQLDSRVQSIAPNPDNDLKIAEITSPFEGEVTAIAAPGETVFFTLRVVGTQAQLRDVRVSGFTASAQASNCRVDLALPEGYFCEVNLRDDNERILFQDTIPPILTINGDNPTVVEVDEPYVELGATAIDNIDGDISSNVLATPFPGPVDSSGVADFWIEYTVSDSAGNPATPVTRTVNVVDTTAPVITLIGDATITLQAGVDSYSELGASVTDAGDSTLVSATVGGDSVDTTTVGSYVVTYDATDAFGNAATQVTRTVVVEDTIAPVITLNGDATVTLQAGVDNYSELGASVSDAGDSTLVSATVGGDTVDTTTVGTYVVTYDATDASSNAAAQVTRTVVVEDTIAPVITLIGVATVTLEAGIDTYTELGASVSDAGDSTLVSATVAGDTVDTNSVGTYVVTYDATDAFGNAAIQKTRTITVVDTTAPVIVLNGAAALTLEADLESYVELGATVTDPGNSTTTLIIGGAVVDTNTVGVYVVTYDANDGANAATQVVRTVTVVDTTAPDFEPVVPPEGFNPDAPYPFELAADANSIFVTWPVSVTDADPNLVISCSIDGTPLPLDGPLTTDGNTYTKTFEYDFPVGLTEVSCTATDSNNQSTDLEPPFFVEVLDVTAPVITAPTDPVVFLAVTAPAVIDYANLVSVFDAVYPDTEATCIPASGSEFPWGDTEVTCTAQDDAEPLPNEATPVSFIVRVEYAYDVNLTLPRGSAHAGSTIPLDWQYLDNNVVIDSSTFMVGVAWEKASNSSCETLTPSDTDDSSFIVDADSGNSDFRYSSSSDTWQFSWQTPDVTGWHKVSVFPPGGEFADAWDCVNLR